MLFLCFVLWIPLSFVKLPILENKFLLLLLLLLLMANLLTMYVLSTELNLSGTLLHLIIPLRLWPEFYRQGRYWMSQSKEGAQPRTPGKSVELQSPTQLDCSHPFSTFYYLLSRGKNPRTHWPISSFKSMSSKAPQQGDGKAMLTWEMAAAIIWSKS